MSLFVGADLSIFSSGRLIIRSTTTTCNPMDEAAVAATWPTQQRSKSCPQQEALDSIHGQAMNEC